jgi:enoyl-CoA hydratase
MSDPAVQYELKDTTAIIRVDDGKANALSQALIADCNAALDRAEKEARAVLLVGRPGRFSAGFDLSVMRQGGQAVAELVGAGADLALRLYGSPQPVVLAVTGHALAMGAVLCLAADERIGAEGDFKIGLNEVAIGMTLPRFALEFARERLSKRHLSRAVAGAEIYTPAGAVDAGFLDRATSPESLFEEALTAAARLAALDPTAHRNTKLRLRGPAIEQIRRSVAEELRPPKR